MKYENFDIDNELNDLKINTDFQLSESFTDDVINRIANSKSKGTNVSIQIIALLIILIVNFISIFSILNISGNDSSQRESDLNKFAETFYLKD